jgi:hypothetical protein
MGFVEEGDMMYLFGDEEGTHESDGYQANR